MTAETARTLERGLRLLELLADHPSGLSPTEAAATLGLSRPAVYRLMTTLQAHGYVRRLAGGRMHVGYAVLPLSAAVLPLLRTIARPVLRELAEQTGATAHLTIAEGEDAVAVAVVEPSWSDVHVAYRVGLRHPLDKGAAGLAILAGRRGETAHVTSEGHLQRGAYGVAAPVPIDGVAGAIEAGVGVVTLAPIDTTRTGPLVSAAAHRLGTALR